jgi:hypothetical protein
VSPRVDVSARPGWGTATDVTGPEEHDPERAEEYAEAVGVDPSPQEVDTYLEMVGDEPLGDGSDAER